MKKITVLGSTGSIGLNTIDVVRLHQNKFEIFALTAHTQIDLMLKQILEFKPKYVVLTNVDAANNLYKIVKNHGLSTTILSGADALSYVASHEEVDIVMGAIVGAAGLKPCLSSVKAGKTLLLANKETLVLGGNVFINAVKDNNANLIPIDSEHSAILQSLPENPDDWKLKIKKIILTASGGPFRTTDINTFNKITPEQACTHPNWSMGKKISIDSATMMNKALEVIEAKFLFNMSPENIEVIIHPQSIIHSMVEYLDASIIAQLGSTDMKIPIAYGLSWPERIYSGAKSIDFSELSALTFEKPDPTRFPSLFLSWEALRLPEGSPGVLNAANEVAVDAFLHRRITFDQIYKINANVLSSFNLPKIQNIDDLIDLDLHVRKYTEEILKSIN